MVMRLGPLPRGAPWERTIGRVTPTSYSGSSKRARERHVAAVYLIGAGLSLEAGVPTTRLMIEGFANHRSSYGTHSIKPSSLWKMFHNCSSDCRTPTVG